MKKFKLYCILGLFGCICLPTKANVTNWLGLSLEGAEWSLMPNQSELKPSLGGGGALSFHYELENKHFLFQTGAGASGGWTQFNVPEVSHTLYNQRDIQNDLMDYLYQFNDRHDTYMSINAQVPLLAGGNWNRFYFLAGAKLGINCITWTQQTTLLTTAANYKDEQGQPLYQNLITNVPAQQYYGPDNQKLLAGKGTTNLNLNVDASVEIGVRLGFIRPANGFDVPQAHTQYRLAVFADYGLMDIHKAQKNQLLEAPKTYQPAVPNSMTKDLKLNDILSTKDVAKSVNNLMVGIKFTILFELVPAPKCVTCEKDTPLRHRKGGTKIEL